MLAKQRRSRGQRPVARWRSSLLTLCLLALLVGGSTCAVAAALPAPRRIELFKRGVTTVPFENKGVVTQRVVHSFRIPSLVEVDGVIIAIADARYDASNDMTFIETAVKYSVDGGQTWETQIAIKNSRVDSKRSRVVDPTVLVEGKKIYVLVGSYNVTTIVWSQQRDGMDWEALLVVGEVKKSVLNGEPKATITWSQPTSLKHLLPRSVGGAPATQFIGGVGRTVVTESGTLIFPVQVLNTALVVYATLMHSSDDGNTWKVEENAAGRGPTESSLVEWNGKLLLNARTDIGYRMVFEADNVGAPWREASQTISRVWGNSPTRVGPGCKNSVLAVTIEGLRVMLLTQPLNLKGGWNRDRLHLWVTDNLRVYDVGQVSHGDENSGYSSLMLSDNKLYCLHETNDNERYSLVLAFLDDHLAEIQRVVRVWKTQDDALSAGALGAAVPTDGLAGLLLPLDTAQGYWHDAYQCVDAVTAKAHVTPYGQRFSGVGGGAQWPVDKQGQNRRYQFVHQSFTLVATVSIGRIPKGDNLLICLAADAESKKCVIGLSYNQEGQWIPIIGMTKGAPTGSWEPTRAYQVMLTLTGDVGSVYVDGKPLGRANQRLGMRVKPNGLSHFAIGGYGDGKSGRHIETTVCHAFLYNRPLANSEANALLQAKVASSCKSERYPDRDRSFQRATLQTRTTLLLIFCLLLLLLINCK